MLELQEAQLWQRYLETLDPSKAPDPSRVITGPAGNAELTDELARLYLDGRKTAGSSLLEDFLAAGDPVPEVGDHWILLGSTGEPRCILRTAEIWFHRFGDIPEAVAIAEGEGDLTVAHWRRAHAELYAPHLTEWGIADLDEATVVTEIFELVFR